MTSRDFLCFAAAVAAVVAGILLLLDEVTIADGLAILCFVVATLAVILAPWRPKP